MAPFPPALVPIIITNAVIAAISVMIYRSVQQSGETAMARFRLKPEKAAGEFKALLGLHLMETAALAVVAYGGITGTDFYIDFGRAVSALYGVGFAMVFYRWHRRFTA